MSKKIRKKKYQGPKYVARNVLSTVFGGMARTHAEETQKLQIKNHKALADIATGTGGKEEWDLIVGAINIGNIMCEMKIGSEYKQEMFAARDAMLAVGVRAKQNSEIFDIRQEELVAVSLGLEIHDAQLEASRSIDVDRAAEEMERRIRNRIKTNSVTREVAKKAA